MAQAAEEWLLTVSLEILVQATNDLYVIVCYMIREDLRRKSCCIESNIKVGENGPGRQMHDSPV